MADSFSNACMCTADICWPGACILVLLPGGIVIIPPLKNFLPPNQAHNVFTAMPMLQVIASLGHPESLIFILLQAGYPGFARGFQRGNQPVPRLYNQQ